MTFTKSVGDIIRSNATRFAKFLSTGFVAFLFSELVIYLGTELFTTRFLVETDLVAAVTSIVLGFFLNDLWTTRHAGYHPRGVLITAVRLVMYEVIYAIGNVISYSIQLALFYYLTVNPLLGNLVGAVVATPVNYVITMKLVWRISVLSQQQEPVNESADR